MRSLFIFVCTFLFSLPLFSQNLSPFWEELTASDFTLAVKQSEGVCIIPIGVSKNMDNNCLWVLMSIRHERYANVPQAKNIALFIPTILQVKFSRRNINPAPSLIVRN